MICYHRTELDKLRLAEAIVDPNVMADDGHDYAGTVVNKPWGAEREVRRTPEFSLWRLQINRGQETSLHCHPEKTTMLTVEQGTVMFSTLAGDRKMTAGESVLIERGVFHRTKAEFGAVILELEWPPNRRDLVRISDRYGREGKGYERAAG